MMFYYLLKLFDAFDWILLSCKHNILVLFKTMHCITIVCDYGSVYPVVQNVMQWDRDAMPYLTNGVEKLALCVRDL